MSPFHFHPLSTILHPFIYTFIAIFCTLTHPAIAGLPSRQFFRHLTSAYFSCPHTPHTPHPHTPQPTTPHPTTPHPTPPHTHTPHPHTPTPHTPHPTPPHPTHPHPTHPHTTHHTPHPTPHSGTENQKLEV
ncbi:hypothetical protein K9N68_03160 [Kovacikia minuta CCNUW1]|uniref:hypothetical protein n=1 Tax=Kovacikia minuta TaxID=2931930 RepID=UPI001CCF5519|nr:hypothetical protein [Kovacikia minuta]UBF26993.1 hypothetical protein K9N68_03160 [Kovacikia minuta CCNUW1]